MLEVGLVGYGRWGRNLARAARSAGATVRWIVDPQIAEFRRQNDIEGIPLFSDMPSAHNVHRVPVVLIAAPTPFHETLADQAIDLGLHFHLEKPFATNYAATSRLLARARDAGLVANAGHEFIYHRAFRELLLSLRLSSGFLDLTWLNDRITDSARYANTWLDLAPHPLSLLAATHQEPWTLQSSSLERSVITAVYGTAGIQARVRVGSSEQWPKTTLAIATTKLGTTYFNDVTMNALMPDETIVLQLTAFFESIQQERSLPVSSDPSHILSVAHMLDAVNTSSMEATPV